MPANLALAAAFLIFLAQESQSAPYKEVLGAMEAEMGRSQKELRLENSGPPYFLLYRLSSISEYSLACVYGDIGRRRDSQHQVLLVEARVGNYDLDNTWEGFSTAETMTVGSLDWNPEPIRQLFWHLTDSAYKNALRKYLDKKARMAEELEEEKLPDFSREALSSGAEPQEPVPVDRRQMENLCRAVSKHFRKFPEVTIGYVNVAYNSDVRLLVNSEGTKIVQEAIYTPYSYYIYGESRADDGLAVDSFRSGQTRHLGEWPSLEEMERLVSEVAAEVKALKKAPIQMPELAPALVDGESSGVFFHEALGHRLEGLRQREKSELQTFKGKVGTNIIPNFLSVYSDPTLTEVQEIPLSGHYVFDSEGIEARRNVLVQQGVLKGYLMSRRPISGFSQSNGSGRSDADSLPEGRMSVLIVEADQTLSPEQLKNRLLEEMKKTKAPFAFRLVAMRSGEAQTSRGSSQSFVARPRLVYRVDPNGRETLVRGLEYVGTPLVAIQNIVAAGNDSFVKNAYCGSTSGFIPVSQVAPSVIVSQIELQRQPEDRFRPPILKGPIFR